MTRAGCTERDCRATFRSMSFRDALPRLGLRESSDLPISILAGRLAASGELCAALEAYREILDAAPDDQMSLLALAMLLGRLGRDDEEIATRKRLAVLVVEQMGIHAEGKDAAVRFELATSGIGPTPSEMPSAYTVALFDSYAAHFNKNLRDDLGYHAPEYLHHALSLAMGPQKDGSIDIFDIGCGTGLLGPLLRTSARRLDGVDCSPRMLDQAAAAGFYDDLAEADLTDALTQRPGRYDVVTAADVFVYIGDLAPAFAALSLALRRNGWFAFTVEEADASMCEGDEGYALGSSGRYVHTPAFVRAAAAAAGLLEVSVNAVTLRREQSRAVKGLVWVWRRR